MLAIILSGALVGVRSHPVQVEVIASESGEARTFIVGLPDAAVKESGDRVRAAIRSSGFKPSDQNTTVNLAPGDLRKEGPIYDLPIALGTLAATGQMHGAGLPASLTSYLVAGELSLSGETRPIRGGLAMAIMARERGLKGVLLPPASAEEAALVEGIEVIPVRSLDQAVRFLEGRIGIEPLSPESSPFRQPPRNHQRVDFAEVKGQHAVRRAVEIAVAGAHNLLMIGPPGSGKSMIAKRIPTIMPQPRLDEFLEILAVHSAAGTSMEGENRCYQRPFRAPHHTISDVGLIGGGTHPGPGEISLAHQGVLFLDELPEFRRSTLEVMRQPLEDGEVTISRSAAKVTLPASIMLVAAMNPTPSGYSSKDGRSSGATPAQIQRYRARISGPLLDRIDIQIEAPALTFEELRSERPGESSDSIRARVETARQRQVERFGGSHRGSSPCNARMSHAQIRKYCAVTQRQGDLLQHAMEELRLSARAYDRILKVARTIADLAGTDSIEDSHLLEAIQFRNLDRQLFI